MRRSACKRRADHGSMSIVAAEEETNEFADGTGEQDDDENSYVLFIEFAYKTYVHCALSPWMLA